MRDSFIFYKSFWENLEEVENPAEVKKIITSVWHYAYNDEEIDITNFSKEGRMIIRATIPLIDAANKNYTNGCKGGRPKEKTGGYSKEKTGGYFKSITNDNENVNVNDKENSNDNDKGVSYSDFFKKNGYIKPSFQDIKTYIDENGLKVDASDFWKFYEANGWLVGNKPMDNWKSTLTNWSNRAKKEAAKNNEEEGYSIWK